MTQMKQCASNTSSAPAVNKEGILEQVLGTRRGHKTRVGCTLSQRIYHDTSSSSSHSEGTSARIDPHVEEYLHQSYEQNLQMTDSHRMMHQLLAQLHPNIQFPMITHLEQYNSLGPLAPPNAGDDDDDTSNTTNLGDSQLFSKFFIFFCIKLTL